MENKVMPMNLLPIGKFGRVKELTAEGNKRRRMLDLGLIENTQIEALRRSPAGDPTAYEIRGAVIALRSDEASKILVEVIQE